MQRARAVVLGLALLVFGTMAAPTSGQDDKGEKKSVKINLENLDSKLVREIVRYYLLRDYKDKREKEKSVKDLAVLGSLDEIPAILTYEFKDKKARLRLDASRAGKRHPDADAAEAALREVVRHVFKEIARDGIQLGKDTPLFVIEKDDAEELINVLAGAVEVVWAPPPTAVVELKVLLERLAVLEARVRVLEKRISEGGDQERAERRAEIDRLERLIKQGGSLGPNGSTGKPAATGSWRLVPMVRLDCTGRWVTVYHRVYVTEHAPAGGTFAGATRLPAPEGQENDNRNFVSLSQSPPAGAREADTRRGSSVGNRIDVRGLKPEAAPELFWTGYKLFWQRDYHTAWQQFDAAVRVRATDARFWYYKALTERILGDAEAAEASRQQGARLEARSGSQAEDLGKALERVQGEPRLWLRRGSGQLAGR
jgi:hypothetical protein